MRLIRFVAVACMVAVSVASLGCGEAEAPAKKAETPAATSSVETSYRDRHDSGQPGNHRHGMTRRLRL